MSLIEARNMSVAYTDTPALAAVDLSIEPGEIVTVIGPNGSGKSTLIRALLGVVAPSGGSIHRKPGLRIGYVPQKLSLDANLPLTVRRFLCLPRRHSAAEIAAMLERVGVPGLQERQMSALSGGQFQRVLLARALLMKPEILILDEATQGLDQPGVAAFYRLIEAIRSEMGCAVLMVSHDLHVVMRATDRVVCLNGHICCEGAPTVVSEMPEYRALFGLGTGGALALYQHAHDHEHDHLGAGDGHDHHHPHHGAA
ncbi:Zinc import ATP-binding protein ZnuC [Pseudoruegeria aquimaris]|uniref:Zinc import ATP-binding protein ZnuC n=1 Tax=Pseudoruegeria aquimaris TaxID=393663 RepID=A0A1Y5TI53_9RHOB|nr:metal ABC transporter ATP-binding protein [Pseudoruegeria aquimaris]SLN60864.1 Zinc import ATP-binding protein ZnuC [Pseudoruegeria aquimaris]